jgi:hypothetical protein
VYFNIFQVTGLLAGGFGLSSGAYTGLYSIFFSEYHSVAPYILFMSISVTVVTLVCTLFLKVVSFLEYRIFLESSAISGANGRRS